MRGSKGQVSVEFILGSVLIVSVALLVARGVRQNEFLSQMISGPWSNLSGMIENGVWGNSEKTKALHPSYLQRHASLAPDDI